MLRKGWCTNCYYECGDLHFDASDHAWPSKSIYRAYFENDELVEIYALFGDGLCLNLCWGPRPHMNLIRVTKDENTILHLPLQSFPFKPDADYLYKKMKLLLTFS